MRAVSATRRKGADRKCCGVASAPEQERFEIGRESAPDRGADRWQVQCKRIVEERTMRIKIHGGTPSDADSSLCHTCRHSRVTRGRKLDEEIVLCEASHVKTTRITFKVTSCSGYMDDRVPTYFELMQQAWVLAPATSKRGAGFVRASDLRDRDFDAYLASLEGEEES